MLVNANYGPVEVRVKTDWLTGRPRRVRVGERDMPVTALRAVRLERAAYPVVTGPRTLFEVDTPSARLALSFQHRSRRWLLQGLDGLTGDV